MLLTQPTQIRAHSALNAQRVEQAAGATVPQGLLQRRRRPFCLDTPPRSLVFFFPPLYHHDFLVASLESLAPSMWKEDTRHLRNWPGREL